jgi:hypothetical protein
MCMDLLTNKYFLLGLLIYIIPGLVGFSIFTSKLGHPFLGGLDFLATVLTCVLFSPISCCIALTYSPYPSPANITWMTLFLIIIPYYVVAYGLLYFYYRHEQTKKSSICINQYEAKPT